MQRAPQSHPRRDRKQTVEACLKQRDDLLPGGVGIVEQVNREVVLNNALGRERKTVEAEIRKDSDARKFVCEAGLPAVLALFYSKDYKNRLDVRRARESFASHPQFYTVGAFDKAQKTEDFLVKKYGITIQAGDKAWSTEDVGLLAEALGKLTDNEIPLIGGYRFLRWSNKCDQLVATNPDYTCDIEDWRACGLHLPNVINREHTITMYDCYKTDPEEFAKKGFTGQPGAETIVHEIGHAIEFGRLRLALERQGNGKRELERLKKLAAGSTGRERVRLDTQVAAAKKELAEADTAVTAAMSPSTLDQFEKLIKGKPLLTPYSGENTMEAFAEAFMLFKVAPEKVKKANKPLFDWFNQGGFL